MNELVRICRSAKTVGVGLSVMSSSAAAAPQARRPEAKNVATEHRMVCNAVESTLPLVDCGPCFARGRDPNRGEMEMQWPGRTETTARGEACLPLGET